MEIMANNLNLSSDDVRLSEGPTTVVLEEKETSIPLFSSVHDDESNNLGAEIPSSTVETTTAPSRDGISSPSLSSFDEKVEVVDSALLYAMRDQRERVALLRLEQTMVDFMNQDDMGYMDVGGPNNSIVISPNNNNNNNHTPGKTTTSPTIVVGGGRQTSFQRCCLHRLADRFHILRETTTNPDNNGMIRLVKVKDSQIPKKLLIDLQVVQEQQQQQPPLECETEYKSGAQDAQVVRALTKKMSDSSIKTTTTKKMKIMKRSSSSMGSSSNSSLKNSDSAAIDKATARNRKNLSDKEKAYAEARARIFNNENENAELKANEEATTMTTTTVGSPPHPPQETPPQRVSPSSWEQQTMTTTTTDSSFSSKVTWRNRREEENDPDFYRLATTTTAGPSLHYHDAYYATPAAVYGYQQQQQQQQYFSAGSQQFAAYDYTSPPVPPPQYSGAPEVYYAPPPLSSTTYYQGGSGHVSHGGRGVSQRSARGEGSQPANVNNMDDFPSLA